MESRKTRKGRKKSKEEEEIFFFVVVEGLISTTCSHSREDQVHVPHHPTPFFNPRCFPFFFQQQLPDDTQDTHRHTCAWLGC